MLPWWLSLLLAVLSFVLFHMLSGMKATSPTSVDTIGNSIWVAIGFVGQFVGPIVFLAGAALSGIRATKQRAVRDSSIPTRAEPEWRAQPSAEIPDDDLYDLWKDASKSESPPPPVDSTRWSRELLNALEWKRFEHLCAAYFETLGFKSQVAREGADGGVDIHLYADGSSAPSIVVQCKAWRAYPVGIKPIRELLGVMTDAGVSEGAFVTTGSYTAEARRFAAGHNMELIDGAGLLGKILAASADDQRALLEVATAGDFTTPTCPSCGTKMVDRVAQKSGEHFWGCARFPTCRRTLRRPAG